MEKGSTIWLVGLSGSGKSTLARKIVNLVEVSGKKVQLIDGDIMREDIGGIFGYSRIERIKAAKVYRAMARLLNNNGIHVVVAAIAPYEEIRQMNREQLANYIEINVSCPIEECIKRDPKGLYKKALDGIEKFVIGIDEEYEVPKNSDLVVRTDAESIEKSYLKIAGFLKKSELLSKEQKGETNGEVAKPKGISEKNVMHWEQYYSNIKQQPPSTFCLFVNDFLTEKYVVLDIGCGAARDSIEFAQRGHHVIGIDKSEQAIKFANSLVKGKDCHNISFKIADISNKVKMSNLFKDTQNQAQGKQVNIMYYSRFFLHSIDKTNQDILLEAISENLKKGDIFVAEFRTREDKARQKTYSDHYRRFVDERDLLEKLKRICNMTELLLLQKGNGLSIYKDEDPCVCRIIMRKS